ncbi:glycosyltransferase [Kineosporia babensis]|uniref:Glycosyltransferase n=1 Tax=Kineosporia babensis TaxID=499548 RepID=A0A9X1NH01_9ACTN|nr:glycosyltransferase [Kineosporia babensis]MCD5314942.1 glycosyltransferase [Kineosporia babensis]
MSTYGSRGDVEPMAALAVTLQELGVEAVVCAPPEDEFRALLERAGVEMVAAGMAVKELIAEAKANPHITLPERARKVTSRQYEAVLEVAQKADVIIGSGLMPAAAGARTVADQLGLPFHLVAFQPVTMPSPYQPPVAYPGRPLPPDVTDNRELWKHDAESMNVIFGAAVNDHRVSVGLPPVPSIRAYVLNKRPWLAVDPVLSPWRPSDLLDVLQTGAWILPDTRPLPAELEAFLEADQEPVYVGFGSMAMGNAPAEVARAAVEAARKQGRRLVMAKGWAGLEAIDEADDCFVVGDVNQQKLFPRVAAVVHHGGAGTTTAAARAGTPQVIVPQVVDQPHFARRVAELGIGVAHEGSVPTSESLAEALNRALGMTRRAQEMAGQIKTDGTLVAARELGVA